MSGDSSGDSSGDEEHVETGKAASFKNLPASVRKMKAESSDSSKESNEDELEDVNGFRLIDIAILAAVFESLLCPSCKQGHVVFEEDKESKMGLASLLILKCTTRKCSFYKSFYTSAKEALGIDPGYHCRKACKKLDHDRIRHSRRKSQEESKKRRRQLRNYKKGFTETLEAREGPSYEAGAF